MDSVPPPPPVAPERKGLHPLAWVGIGCGGLLVIAIIGVALVFGFFRRKVSEIQADMAKDPTRTAAELIVSMNPEVEMVNDDEGAGEMTIRVKSTGEEITVAYDDLASGKFTVKQPDGSVTTIGGSGGTEIPAWVPRYPKVAEETAAYHQDTANGSKGLLVYSTHDSVEEVAAFYEAELASMSSQSSSSVTFGSTTQLKRAFSGGDRTIEVNATSPGSGQATQVQLNYEEKTP